MARLSLLFSRDQIAEAVQRLAYQIRQDYQGQRPLLVGVLKGSFIFLADLVRELDHSLEIDFVRLASYGSRQESTSKVRIQQGLRCS